MRLILASVFLMLTAIFCQLRHISNQLDYAAGEMFSTCCAAEELEAI